MPQPIATEVARENRTDAVRRTWTYNNALDTV